MLPWEKRSKIPGMYVSGLDMLFPKLRINHRHLSDTVPCTSPGLGLSIFSLLSTLVPVLGRYQNTLSCRLFLQSFGHHTNALYPGRAPPKSISPDDNSRFSASLLRSMVLERQSTSRTFLDLRLAVARQGKFYRKDALPAVLRSPALPHTMSQTVHKIPKFMYLVCHHTDQLLVPTLDVDLAWTRTSFHLCDMNLYSRRRHRGSRQDAMRGRVGRGVDHNDRIGKRTR